ncbi:MAG: tRNA (guanine37-N1)-methyltransferase [Cellvibrionaceae bacterium]|jgi:tRNA (guanine37-N1)-methyltransferase
MRSVVVITLFPEMFAALTDYGVTGRAIEKGLLKLSFINPRDFAEDKRQTVDDRPYGGGPGMVMKVQPLQAAIRAARDQLGEPAKVVYLSPQGGLLNQLQVQRFAEVTDYQRLILLSGRYEGVDERLLVSEVDEEWSIGDYVLSGGEFAAMVILDAVIRLLPGALGHEDSAEQDSFSNGLLDYPQYTRPDVYQGLPAPEVLLSGNHQHIERWRLQQSLGRTWLRRPELLKQLKLTTEQKELLDSFQRVHAKSE